MPLCILAAPAASGATFWDKLTAIATALGAVATFAAVIVALRLARREEGRHNETNRQRALAQARLVRLIKFEWSIGGIDDPAFDSIRGGRDPDQFRFRFPVVVLNASDRLIMDVVLNVWVGDLSGDPIKSDPGEFLPVGEEHPLVVRAVNPDSRAPVAIRVTWSDGDGRRWYRDVLPSTDVQPQPQEFTGQPPQRFR